MIAGFTATFAMELRAFGTLVRAGMLRPQRPSQLARMVLALRKFGPFGSVSRLAALQFGPRCALVDDGGQLTFDELDTMVRQSANLLLARGAGAGDSIGILCANHRWPLIVAFAAARSGMNVVWLNTSFAPRQAAEVAARECVQWLVYDSDLRPVADAIEVTGGRFSCNVAAPEHCELAMAVGASSPTVTAATPRSGKVILLTSGTTGTPKGAQRPDTNGLVGIAALLDRVPMRRREVSVIGPPMFHGTGLGVALISMALGSELILRKRFDAKQFLLDIETHCATVACVVPTMLQRIIAFGDDHILEHNVASLRVLLSAGSRLPAAVFDHGTRLFGNVIYNLYGSTEISMVSIATPEDMLAAGGTVGRPVLGTQVKIVDGRGAEVPPGTVGRIVAAAAMTFAGYTGGGSKDDVAGLLTTGDMGRMDNDGRLWVEGRHDEMIISGGENVYPSELEDLLLTHDAIVDAAAVGVADAEYGERLCAFVVVRDRFGLSEGDVKSFARSNLARFKVPRDVIFLSELPRNAMGKVVKTVLAATVDTQESPPS